MVTSIRGLFVGILLALVASLPTAWATSFTTDQSDVWSVVGEDGWGYQIVQRGSVIFVTMYVYGPSTAPIWYTATLFYAGNFVWNGDLFVSSGPWFGTQPFNPSAVGRRKVGTMKWTALTTTTGQLQYDVDGTNVVKNATRFSLALDDFSGRYGGGLHSQATGCANAGFNGTVENMGVLNITQNGTALTMTSLPTSGGSCTFVGTLTQSGQMGAVIGSYSCSSGDGGSFQIFEMQVNITGITGRFVGSSNVAAGCQLSGWFGGIRVTTF